VSRVERRTLLLLPVIGLLAAGCRPAADAPEELAELCAFVFTHAIDEDPAQLIAGVEQLGVWLDAHPEEVLEGYRNVAIPTEATMDSLDDADRTNAAMVGLAVGGQSRHPLDETAWGLIAVDQDVIYPDDYDAYERSYLSGPDCFLDHTCDFMEAVEDTINSFPLGLTSENNVFNQYRWVVVEQGTALVHRNWLTAPPVVSSDILQVDEQAYIDVLVPGDDGIWRLQSQFTIYAVQDEDIAINAAINYLADLHDGMETWLDDNQAP